MAVARGADAAQYRARAGLLLNVARCFLNSGLSDEQKAAVYQVLWKVGKAVIGSQEVPRLNQRIGEYTRTREIPEDTSGIIENCLRQMSRETEDRYQMVFLAHLQEVFWVYGRERVLVDEALVADLVGHIQLRAVPEVFANPLAHSEETLDAPELPLEPIKAIQAIFAQHGLNLPPEE